VVEEIKKKNFERILELGGGKEGRLHRVVEHGIFPRSKKAGWDGNVGSLSKGPSPEDVCWRLVKKKKPRE